MTVCHSLNGYWIACTNYLIISDKTGNFIKHTEGVDVLNQPYDYGSIMHYGAHAGAIDPSKFTIEPKQPGVTIGYRKEMSPTDIKSK